MDKMTTNSEERPRGARLQPHPPERKERAYQLYEQGKSNSEIANELEIPPSTINRWSSKGKWKVRRQLAGRPGTELGALAPTDQDILDEISQLSFVEKHDRYAEIMSDGALRFAYTVRDLPPQGLLANADKIKKLDETARKALKLESDKPRTLINIGLLSHGSLRLVESVSDLSAEEAATYDEHAGCKPAAEPAGDAAAIAAEPGPQPTLPASPIAPGAGL